MNDAMRFRTLLLLTAMFLLAGMPLLAQETAAPAQGDDPVSTIKQSLLRPDDRGNVKVTISDYLKEGDSITLKLNVATHAVQRMSVSSYTNKARNTVDLDVAFDALADGTIHPAKIDLEVAKEHLGVSIKNSGYEKLGG